MFKGIKIEVVPILITMSMIILGFSIPISYSRGYDKGRQDMKVDAIMVGVAKWGTNTLSGGIGFYWVVDGVEYYVSW